MPDKTHREVKDPKISLRFLADYMAAMAASSTAQRSILRGCKYPPIARLIQHKEAKQIVSKFVRSGNTDTTELEEKAQELRKRLADSQFDRDLYDHNADYLSRFAKVHGQIGLPKADLHVPGPHGAIEINGVKVTPEIHFRLQRLTKTNETRLGAGMLRYQKGKPLSPQIASWQSALLLGYLIASNADTSQVPEGKLCVTLDAYSGTVHPAPSNAKQRYNQAESACETISEWWPGIKPPPGAVI